MLALNRNLQQWDREHAWTRAGDEWSGPWRSADYQWYGSLLPQLYAYLPVETSLEVTPGYDRWIRYLKDRCRDRFTDANHFMGEAGYLNAIGRLCALRRASPCGS